MREDTVVQLRQPGTFSEDSLTEVLHLGARRRAVPSAISLTPLLSAEAFHDGLLTESGAELIFVPYMLPRSS